MRTIAEDVFTPLIIIVFFSVVFVTGVIPVEAMKTTWGVVTEVFVMVKSLVVQPAVFEPSIIV